MNGIKRFLIAGISTLFALQALAQRDTVRISGNITFEDGKNWNMAVILYPYDDALPSFNADVKPDGSFTFAVPVTGVSMYEMHYSMYSRTFIITPAERSIGFIIKAGPNGVGMGPYNSMENQAFDTYKNINNGFKDNIKSFMQGCGGNAAACEQELVKNIGIVNSSMDGVHQQFPGTFTGDFLATTFKVPVPDASQPALPQLRQHFFDLIDWSDKRSYITTDLMGRITSYLDYLADTSATGRLIFINKAYEQTKGNKEAQKQLMHLLFTNFVPFNRETYIQILVSWTAMHPELETEQPVMNAKIKLLAKILPGRTAPDVWGTDADGNKLTLYNALKQNKLTMLVFWDTDCPHCRQSMPEFSRLYGAYHSKGLNVYAASLDTDKDKWKQFVNEKQLAFTNVILPEGHTANGDYDILYTPTVVLIDKNGKIIHRFENVEDLDRYISQIL